MLTPTLHDRIATRQLQIRTRRSGRVAAAKPSAASTTPKPWYSDLKADALIGKVVVDKTGDEVGEIDNVMLNSQNQSPAAVIGVGGFFGFGEKKIALPLADLQPRPAAEQGYESRYTEDELKGMQAYADSQYRPVDRNATLAAAK